MTFVFGVLFAFVAWNAWRTARVLRELERRLSVRPRFRFTNLREE